MQGKGTVNLQPGCMLRLEVVYSLRLRRKKDFVMQESRKPTPRKA